MGHPRIIHRDIKSSNILLDNNYDARVSDFGLAKLALDSNTHVTTRVMGTFGYMAPEYATSGKLTEKSDVYSFGVVLLELITGRKSVDASQPLGDESLVEWARPLLSQALDTEDFGELVDPRLGKNFDENEMFRMMEAAAACVRHSAAKRPRMGQVVRALDSMDEFSDLNNGMKPGQSEVFDPSQQSVQIRMFQRMAFGSQEYSTEFFERTHSSWGSRDHRDRTQSSFGSSRENRVQHQRSWASREQGDQSTTITSQIEIGEVGIVTPAGNCRAARDEEKETRSRRGSCSCQRRKKLTEPATLDRSVYWKSRRPRHSLVELQ
ncbi:hypothetical protein TIFTF001_026754 [Ficus carica]|uniref:non-specific serine/threonine protein kinase n=1 Tax=Ficus carica TaxID=3494 RepID=A0AA88DLS4_FICCA|nr:hypothetical protein TIFTF001_026754 [Ficus carica]